MAPTFCSNAGVTSRGVVETSIWANAAVPVRRSSADTIIHWDKKVFPQFEIMVPLQRQV